jgi:hypothetical protein
MTRAQFAMAILSDEKWVDNSARILGRRLRYTAAEARWLGLVRLMNQGFGIDLGRASSLADAALAGEVMDGSVVLGEEGGSTGMCVDLARYHSAYAAGLSAALELGGERRRGRKAMRRKGKAGAVERATEYGVDIGLLREGLLLSPKQRLEAADENAMFVKSLRSSVAKNA